jgi:hypothetical protein
LEVFTPQTVEALVVSTEQLAVTAVQVVVRVENKLAVPQQRNHRPQQADMDSRVQQTCLVHKVLTTQDTAVVVQVKQAVLVALMATVVKVETV